MALDHRRPGYNRKRLATGGALFLSALAACVSPTKQTSPSDLTRVCHPEPVQRPICPRAADAETGSFIDPTASITNPALVSIQRNVYIGPFANLAADKGPIEIGYESNVQDHVKIEGRVDRSDAEKAQLTAAGFTDTDGVRISNRVILTHSASIRGPARLGFGGGKAPAEKDDDDELFLSYGSQVDGAILERNSGMAMYSRVGPGVTLRSGFLVLSGKNVTTQAEADDPSFGKVERINEDAVALAEVVLEVNITFAKQYAKLFRDEPSNVKGINYDPGNGGSNPKRDLPKFGSPPSAQVCLGDSVRRPEFRNRIIGDICFSNTLDQIDTLMGSRISLRADEGEPLRVGAIRSMKDGVLFHALEDTDVILGNDITYGEGAIVHGGGQKGVTQVKDGAELRPFSMVYRSTIGAGAIVGTKTAVIDSHVPDGTILPDGVIYQDNQVIGLVEW